MKQILTLGEQTIEVVLFPSQKKGTINGQAFTYEKTSDSLTVNGKYIPYDCVRDETGKVTAVILQGKFIPVQTGRSAQMDKTKRIKLDVYAPLNGLIVRVLTSLNERVQKGDVLLTLEAMKMENEFAAPISGRVKELSVTEREVVKAGQLLFRIEPEGDLSL